MSLTISTAKSELERTNALFLLRSSLGGINLAVENLINPIARIAEEARSNLTFEQTTAVENAFSLRTVNLKRLLAQVRTELAQPESKIFSNLNGIRARLEALRNEYLKSEMVFGLYVDLLHTRAIEVGIGKILKGYDRLATVTLRHFLSPLGHEIPTVIVYLEQLDSAAILRAGVSLWDRMRNPCAVIKLPQSTLNIPRSSIFHEAGHQIASITGLNREVADLLYSTVRSAGGTHRLAQYYRFCATEIVADQVANQMTNWIGAVTLYNIYSGGSGSTGLGTAARMFGIIPRDTHLNGYLRIRCAIESSKLALGARGPWTDFEKTLEILYPVSLASERVAHIINESLPLLPSICKALATTKLTSFAGRSFEQMYPMRLGSLNYIRKLLNIALTNFSVGMRPLLENPVLTLVSFGTLQMMGGKTLHWISYQMRKWLISLGGTLIE